MTRQRRKNTKKKRREPGWAGARAVGSATSGGRGRFGANKWFSFEWLAYAVVVLALWLSAVVFVPGIADEFRLPKLALSEALLLLSALFLALSTYGLGRLRTSRRLLLIVAPLLVVAVASVLLGAHPDHGRIALWNFFAGLVVLVAWGSRPLGVERVLGWLVVPAVAAGSVILLQRFDLWNPLTLDTNRSRLLLTGFVGNVGEASLYLALPVSVCVVKALRAWVNGRKVRATVVWGGALAVLVGALVATETVTALALVVMSGGLLVLLLPISRKTRWIAVALVAMVVVVTLVTPAGDRVWKKLDQLAAFDLEELTTARTDGWKAARYLLKENPVLGVGFGAFGAEFTSAKEAELAAGTKFFTRHVGQSTFSNAHNELLEWAAETGWVGVLVLAWALFAVSVRVRRGWPSGVAPGGGGKRQAAEFAFEAGVERSLQAVVLVMLSVLCLTYFPFRTALLGYPAVLLLAALLGPSRQEFLAETEPSRRAVARWVIVAGIVGLLVVSMVSSKRRVQSSARLFVSEAAARSMMEKKKIYPTLLRPLMAPLEEALVDTPWDERIALALGSFHRLMREPDKAIDWYNKSLEIAPRPETIDNLGRAQLALGQREQAVEQLTRAVLLDPRRMRAVPKEVEQEVRRAVIAARRQSLKQ